ncbi:hypothetical protein GGI01_003327 [Coemansia sp. RSA 376]|nr:hypothetical protein H4S03_001964 [Coemansia sp. S3946]KAJ2068113.1 hypothetical protein GGI08_001049 [Coemansia sp. S2]KAJ2071196.1 hypothetical protein GGH13_003507 [Coemansia sp. S155-1]KAJ2114088.1 hypothetical protein IW146_003361 [Coemansia sp. RSA 922]KAJ2259919.1 hypothetical protein GGI01_003327 [Coemansia sp. RSA 376]KAJ2349199.1 hypothetical protein GGH92_002602 [Coemansia sp. RSA 2673]KAJ2466255.1 hypothetical protein GGI03_002211 [Coemansia sp. RSA 2337]
MKLSSHVLVCALAATTAVAAPAFAPGHRAFGNLLNPGGNNGGNIVGVSLTVTNRDDANGIKSNGEQALSALIAGKIDNYYSYVGNAASIMDKYMADSEVASFASEIIPLLKFPSPDPELQKVNESILARLEDPAVQKNFASVMEALGDYADYYANYVKSEIGVDIYSAMVANFPSEIIKFGDDDAPQTPTASSSTTSKPSSTPAAPSSSVSTRPSSIPAASSSSDDSSPSDSSSPSSPSSSPSSDSKTNSAGSIGVASLSKIALGVAVGALVALF